MGPARGFPRRFLLAAIVPPLILYGAGARVAAAPAPPARPAHARAASAAGTTVLPSSTDTARYSRTANGQIQVQLYNSPVGLPDRSGWRFRDPTLAAPAGTGTVTPAHLPFDLHLAVSGAAPLLASLTSENGIGLGIGLPASAGQKPAIAARTANGAVSYASAFSAPGATADLSLQPTVAGLDARMSVGSSGQAGPFVFALKPDPRTRLSQSANGAIIATQTLPLYTDQGVQYGTEQEPEYIIEPPQVRDSSAGPASPASRAPASMTLTSSATGGPHLSVRVDSAWLRDPHRAFPVRVDVPIVTANAAFDTGLLGTLNSCAPHDPASQGEVIVGAAGGCAYHGQLYFDVSTLWPGMPIVSAALNLYTPQQTGPSGVQILPNVPPAGGALGFYAPVSWEPPSWDSAPHPAAGAAPIAQSGSNGHWQSWDVTALVRQWVDHRAAANGGLTLVGSAVAPVAFASPLGAGADGPAEAPSLTITLAPDAFGTPADVFGMNSIPNSSASASPTIQAAYTRIGAVLACEGQTSTDWSSSYAQVLDPRVALPLVTFVEDYSCTGGTNDPQNWQAQVKNYIDGLRTYADAHGGYQFHALVFEIGNEPNTHSDFGNYPAIFTAAAQGVNAEMPAVFPGIIFSIFTGGVTAPVAQSSGCGGASTLTTIENAINSASQTVSAGLLGVAVHPYSYATGSAVDPNLWQNYRHWQVTGNPCFRLDTMIGIWTSGNPGRNLVFTEINYSSQLPFGNNDTNSEGSYLIDLLNWMWNRGYAASSSPVCLAWFKSNDFPVPGSGNPPAIGYFGIYTVSGGDKFTVPAATTNPAGGYFSGLYCPNFPDINGQNPSFAVDWQLSTTGPCYPG